MTNFIGKLATSSGGGGGFYVELIRISRPLARVTLENSGEAEAGHATRRREQSRLTGLIAS